MSYVGETMSNLLHQTAFLNLTWGNFVMIAVAFLFLFLAIKKEYEPLLLVPIAFGMLLVNIYPDIIISPEEASNGVGGLLHYFYILDEWSILPSLIFLGVGAMTDFWPLDCKSEELPARCSSSVRYFRSISRSNGDGIFRQGCRGNFYHRRGRRADFYFPCGKTAADGNFRTNRGGSILVYVTGADYPAADYETTDDKERTSNQDGTVKASIQTGKNSVPDYRYNCCMRDSAYDDSSGRYADAW